MQNPKFSVTAFTVTVLVVICAAKVALYPFLPPSGTEKFVTIDRRHMLPAATVELDWRSDPAKAIEEAVRTRKALVWLVIDPRDYNAKQLETEVFRDPEIVRFVRRYFVAVKLNSDDHPEVERQIFPISRLQAYLRPGATVLSTTPSGHLIGMIRPRASNDHMSTISVQFQLLGQKKVLDKLNADPSIDTELDTLRKSELEQIAQTGPGNALDGLATLERIKASTKTPLGGFNTSGFVELRPSTLDLLLEVGQSDLALDRILKYAASPGYDVLGGGVFDGLELAEKATVISSKSVLVAAAFAETLATLNQMRPDPRLELLLNDCLASIETGFVAGGSIFEGRMSDRDETGFSRKYSLLGSRIDSKLTPAESQWVRKNLLMDGDQSQYFPRLNKIELLADPILASVREKLKPKLNQELQHTLENRSYVVGTTCARLLRVYQLSSNKRALELFRQLEPTLKRTVSNGMVLRIAGSAEQKEGWLGSYVAVADALLQNYLVLGDKAALQLLTAVLGRLENRFEVSGSEWLATTPDGVSPIQGLDGMGPDLVDPGYESTIAIAVRVLDRAEAVLSDRNLATRLHDRAATMISALAPFCQNANITVSGFVRSSIQVTRDVRIEVVGDFNSAAREFPLEFVCPARNPVPSQAGLYLYRTGTRTGPFTVQQVREQLSGLSPVAEQGRLGS